VHFVGRSHNAIFTFCDHESLAATLVRFGFWPSSPVRPSAAFSIELLRLMQMLTLECAVSVKGFVQTLRWMHNLSSKEVNNIFIHGNNDIINYYDYICEKN